MNFIIKMYITDIYIYVSMSPSNNRLVGQTKEKKGSYFTLLQKVTENTFDTGERTHYIWECLETKQIDRTSV